MARAAKSQTETLFFLFSGNCFGDLSWDKEKRLLTWDNCPLPFQKKQHNSQVTNGSDGRWVQTSPLYVQPSFQPHVFGDCQWLGGVLGRGWWLSFCLVLEGISRQLGKESEARLTLTVQSSLNKAPKPQLEKKKNQNQVCRANKHIFCCFQFCFYLQKKKKTYKEDKHINKSWRTILQKQIIKHINFTSSPLFLTEILHISMILFCFLFFFSSSAGNQVVITAFI